MKCLYDYVGLYFNKLSRISLYLLHVFLILLCFAYYMIGVVFIDYEPCYMRHQQLTLEKIVEIKQYFFFAYFPFILLSLCVFALMLINIITEQTELKIKYEKNYSLAVIVTGLVLLVLFTVFGFLIESAEVYILTLIPCLFIIAYGVRLIAIKKRREHFSVESVPIK